MAVIAIPPIIEGLIWLGAALGIGHQVAPGKEGREQSIRDLGNAMSMSNAQDDAKANADTGTTAATCASGKCAEDCAPFIQQIEAQAAVVQGRLEYMGQRLLARPFGFL
jgi:hypothetical protein